MEYIYKDDQVLYKITDYDIQGLRSANGGLVDKDGNRFVLKTDGDFRNKNRFPFPHENHCFLDGAELCHCVNEETGRPWANAWVSPVPINFAWGLDEWLPSSKPTPVASPIETGEKTLHG